MILQLQNCRVVDPTQNVDPTSSAHASLSSLWIDGSKLIDQPPQGSVSRTIDVHGAWVMAGGIDLHTHIGGGKVNLARMLLGHLEQRSAQRCLWPTLQTGQLYAEMGYTTCFEPAMMLSQARHTHLELADTPLLDAGAYVLLGNEEWLLQALGRGIEDSDLQNLVAWTVRASKAHAVKVVNPGGISAFKFNERALNIDQAHPLYGVTPRDVLRRLTAAVDELQLPHPLHVHASNLGVAGNIESTLATLEAAEGRRLHLTHAQFHCYSGPFQDQDAGYAMGSGAEHLSRYVNAHDNISIDVGQIVFGRTVTISADAAAQFRNRQHAHPKHWLVGDIECQAGCGVVPMRYSDRNYVHSLQWTIGLELLLLIEDPWRVFLTTDHPNGGPFTSYPHLIRLLMDRSFRQSMLERIHPQAAKRTLLRELTREYTLQEIAIITRAAPARILGLHDRGSLLPGKQADVVAYLPKTDWESTFTSAHLLLKHGVEVIRDGLFTGQVAQKSNLRAFPAFDSTMSTRWSDRITSWLKQPTESLVISEDELAEIYATCW